MKYEVRSAKSEVPGAKCVLVMTALLVLPTVPALGATDVPEFESFRIVLTRNIFDPDRRAPQPVRLPKPVAPLRADRLTLTGVLISERGAVGFFEGTKPEYNADVEPGEAVAGYRVAEIRTDCVKLTRDGRQIELPVGSGLSKQGGGDWEVSSAASSSNWREWTSQSGESGGTELSLDTSAAESKSEGVSFRDMLEKLKERRTKELNR